MRIIKTTLLPLALLALCACEDQAASIQILQMQALDLGECTASTSEADSVGKGTIDLAINQNYRIRPYVQNNMLDVIAVNQFKETDGRIDTHDVLLTSAVIKYTALDQLSANIPAQVNIPVSGSVPVDGAAVMDVEVLTSAMIQEIRQSAEFLVFDAQSNVRPTRASVTLIIRVTLKGATLDGTEVESNEFAFPIEVCNGCSISYPPSAVDPNAGALPNCAGFDALEEISEVATTCPGALGRDGVFVDCRVCKGFAVDSIARQLCDPPVAP